nr:uncharacterized protein LOC109156648 [Ipomoea batatas]
MSHNSTSMEFDANWGLNQKNEPLESYQQMLFDITGPNLIARNVGEEPNVEDKRLFNMLDATERQLCPGCEMLTRLSARARLLNIKTEYRLPELGCMLYWGADKELTQCKFCQQPRWHNEDHGLDSGVMCHPFNSEAWKHFNGMHPSFASESRNVRLGLCTDGFQPFGQS